MGLSCTQPIDYERLASEAGVSSESWRAFVVDALVGPWLSAYRAATAWPTEVVEIEQGALTFLFDGAPTFNRVGGQDADDRVVAVWGTSIVPLRRRDRSRVAGFLPNPLTWSGRQRDRGHFVAHTAGGGLDLNLFPQDAGLNRGRGEQGRRWRRIERYAAGNPGTPLFVRPTYAGDEWTPAALDYGVLTGEGLWVERFVNVAAVEPRG